VSRTHHEPSKEQFLKDVAEHQMQILHYDGVRRHIRFKRPGTGCYYFDLVTWPGALCYTGDMGTYVFSRLEDMFEFFRVDRRNGVEINPSYWAEKCISIDRSGLTEFSPDRLHERVSEWLDEAEASQDLRDDVACSVLSAESLEEAHRKLYEFEHDGISFQDSWEWDLTRWTFRFIWCCRALAWGIEQFDKQQAPS
jgi:hypothetical protein